MPLDVADYFPVELAKVLTRENNLSKLSAFFFLFRHCILRRIFAPTESQLKTFFGYSIVKHL